MFMILNFGFPILDLTINCKSSIIINRKPPIGNQSTILISTRRFN
jgi:flagellar assembly factor FliW